MDWLILECEIEPSEQQLELLQQAYNKGRTAVLFGQQYHWCWMYGINTEEPWLN
jgi:hypothetical protein